MIECWAHYLVLRTCIKFGTRSLISSPSRVSRISWWWEIYVPGIPATVLILLHWYVKEPKRRSLKSACGRKHGNSSIQRQLQIETERHKWANKVCLGPANNSLWPEHEVGLCQVISKSSLESLDIILKAVGLLKDYKQGCHIVRKFLENFHLVNL